MLRNIFLTAVLLFIPFSVHADYRPNHGGWAHGHHCEGSKLDECEPHHHILDKIGIRVAVRQLLHFALVENNLLTDLPKRLGPDRYWDLRQTLKESFIEYFYQNQKELLEAIPQDLGNAVGACDYAPPKETEELRHSVDECEAFKAGRTLPTRGPSKERASRPNIEDFIENYLERRPEKI